MTADKLAKVQSIPEARSFVDPRGDPDPRHPRPPARFTTDPDELADLHRYCREGRLYDVERWIRAGRPLQLRAGWPVDGRRRPRSALEIAFDRRNFALLLLLLANGYDQAAEPQCPLDLALQLRRKDLLGLLLEWGADPHQVSVEALCDTYDSELYERFKGLGIDFTSGHGLAYSLAYHPSNKPLFGFAKRHRPGEPKIQVELDIALAYHAGEGNEKGVMLCLWAGANPHTKVPDIQWGSGNEDEEEWSSAVYTACSNGHAAVLDRFGPDPTLDDYEELYRCASNGETVEILTRSKLPKDASTVVVYQLGRSAWAYGNDRPVEALKALFEAGVRWESSPKEEIGAARRDLLRLDNVTFQRIMRLLATDDYCSQGVLTELARTSAFRRRMKELRLIPDTGKERGASRHSWSALPRRALGKFGIGRPKDKKLRRPKWQVSLPRSVTIGQQSARRSELKSKLRLDRRELFEQVWSTPVETLAGQWGLSGRGLAKGCARLRIPVPPRGYWAKVKAGQRVRRPRLPDLPAGQGEEIVIFVRDRSDREG